jgi:hypothetical protein
MLTPRLLRYGAFFVLFALLFAQAAVAANACLRPLSALAAAHPQQSAHCEAQQKIGLNLCLYHCADQSDQYTPQPVIPAAAMPVLSITQMAFVPVISPRPCVATGETHDPPILIRFCSFLI